MSESWRYFIPFKGKIQKNPPSRNEGGTRRRSHAGSWLDEFFGVGDGDLAELVEFGHELLGEL